MTRMTMTIKDDDDDDDHGEDNKDPIDNDIDFEDCYDDYHIVDYRNAKFQCTLEKLACFHNTIPYR